MINVKNFVCFLFLVITFSGCKQREQNEEIVKLSITTKSRTLDSVIVTDYSKLAQSKIIKTSLDSLGDSKLILTLKKGCFLSLLIGNVQSELFLAPGFDLTVNLSEEDIPTISYIGKGAEINNYLNLQNRLIENIKTLNGTYIFFLEPEKFIKRLDTLKNSINEFHRSYIDTTTLESELLVLLKKIDEVKIASVCQEYLFFHNNNAVSNGKKNFSVNIKLENFINPSILYDTTLLDLGQIDFSLFLQLHLQNTVYLPIFINDSYRKDEYLIPIASAQQIDLANYPHTIKEFLSASNVQYWLSMKGINPSTDSIFNSFKSQYRKSKYVQSLEETYNKFIQLSNGRQAPNIKGIKLDGDTLSLEELRGKVVYIDVWATWCGPCREEFPHMKKLQENFKNNENIVFLNVSVDRDKEAWRNFIKSGQTPKGIHIINDGSIYNTYLISGIPRYILIDNRGKIINADAFRPSSKGIKDQLIELIH
ncbi:MAG: TlpA family protein disulfide reductase [Chryseotalea sp.]|jgi:thiol-disulfide isomerase/thioredoxin